MVHAMHQNAAADWVRRAPALASVRHGFFTRLGGVSEGPFASLNCSVRSSDDPEAVRENRARVAQNIGVAPDLLLGVTQVHGADVVTVTAPWTAGQGAPADAMVTTRSDVALGVITADCGPVLFASRDGRVVGAAHAGWRGAVGGILEATLRAMNSLGAPPATITAVVGPCIGRRSYEVGSDMRDAVLAGSEHADAARWFTDSARDGHYQFDLAGYCMWRLERAGVGAVSAMNLDTLSDERSFFSHRRRTLAGGGPLGHQISVIAAGSSGQA